MALAVVVLRGLHAKLKLTAVAVVAEFDPRQSCNAAEQQDTHFFWEQLILSLPFSRNTPRTGTDRILDYPQLPHKVFVILPAHRIIHLTQCFDAASFKS